MKHIVLLQSFLILTGIANAQNNVGIGTLSPHASARLHVHTGNTQSAGFLVSGAFNLNAITPDLGVGSRMMFYPGKAAFRAGYVSSTEWDNINVGSYSVAMGYRTIASGSHSFAIGFESTASGDAATALGVRSTASGITSIAMGNETTASGKFSTAMGTGTVAKANGATTIGLYNDATDQPLSPDGSSTDRIFQIGNGFGGSSSLRKNALTILRNGNVGIGNGALAPIYRLDIDSRMRIQSGGTGGTSAGIWLNRNDNSALAGFVGVDDNNNLGIFTSSNNSWSFLVNNTTGNVSVKGTVTANGVTLTSDERLKKDIFPLGNTMQLLEKLSGYQYHWKDETFDGSLQTGLLAQEVEKVMPELVKTDDKGMKSVNYNGLTPYLLEAIKEQQRRIEMLEQMVLELKRN